MGRYVGVDLGATTLRAVVGDADGGVRGRAARPTPAGPSGPAVTAAVCDVVREACAAAGVAPTAVEAAGIGALGPLDRDAGCVVDPANLPDVDRISLVDPLAASLDAPVVLRNDATAGVVGERAARDDPPENLVYLTLSSGIGAGVVVDGHVLSGRNGNAGEVGHVVVDPDGGMRCGCGRPGHWEAYCAGEHLPRYARHLHDGDETALAVDDPDLSAADVFALAGADDFVDRLLDRVGRWNAIGVATLVGAYAPDEVRVGGAVARNNPRVVIDPVRERLPGLVPGDAPALRLAACGADAVVRGALASAIRVERGD